MKSTLPILMIIAMLTGCTSHKISLTPEKTPSGVEFHIDSEKVNGLLHLTVWELDSRRTLWDINLTYFADSVIKYGQLPTNFTVSNGSVRSATQIHPKQGNALPLPKEETIFVLIDYQYDEFLSGCARKRYFAFRLDKDGNTINLGEQDHIPVGKHPDIWDAEQSIRQVSSEAALSASPDEPSM